MKAVLDHIGIAVQDMRAAVAFYRDLLGLDIEAPEEVVSQRVRAHFIPAGEARLELLEATAPDSPIATFIEKRGPGLHHITLRVEDIAAALAELEARGARLIDRRPRPGAEGALVAFIHPSSAHGVLVELKQASVAPGLKTGPTSAGGPPVAPGLKTGPTGVGPTFPPPSGLDSDRTSARLAEAQQREGGRSGEAHITKHTLGDLELISLYDGLFRLDGGSMFGVVPRPLWSAKAPPDDRNRITLAMRPLIVRGVRTMIIDAGLGDKEDAKFRDIYGVERARHLDHALAEAGLSPDDIDIVLATHLHFDHAGGFTMRDASGRIRPRFPRARYVVRRGEWEDATHPHERNRASYRQDNFVPLAEAGVLDLVDDDQTIMPGVRVRRTGGHTMHHQMVWMESGGQHAAFVGDLMPTTAHLPDAWIMGFDLYPMDTLAAKKAFVREAIERRALVYFEHDPAVAAGYIVEEDGKRWITEIRN